MSNAQDLGAAATGGNFVHTGPANDYGTLALTTFQGNVFANYGGTANNFQNVVAQNTLVPVDQPYEGYAINFATSVSALPSNPGPNDNMPVLTWPKDKQIYYKMVGFNTNTQTFETWIIAEEIVPRPETFDPTGNFPNIDYNVFFTPPSGNKLVNIKIVGRWIQ